MTTGSDKAKNKLLDSMRMSKQGNPSEEKAPAPAAKKAAPAKKAAKKSAAKKKTPAKQAKSSRPGNYSTREGRASIIADGFESGRRIWPD